MRHCFATRAAHAVMATLAAAMLPAALGACSHLSPVASTPGWDARFGSATRLALAGQVLDVEAGREGAPVTGIDGHAAQQAYQRYQKSFSEPPPRPVFIIGDGAK